MSARYYRATAFASIILAAVELWRHDFTLAMWMVATAFAHLTIADIRDGQ